MLGADGPDARFHLGFTRDVEAAELDRWMATQDEQAMLDTMHPVDVQAGDVVLVPAGLPHAIGAGIFCLELQEPTDFSVMLEWKRFGQLTRAARATRAERRSSHATASSARRSPATRSSACAAQSPPRATRSSACSPQDADAFFRAELIRTADGRVGLEAGFGDRRGARRPRPTRNAGRRDARAAPREQHADPTLGGSGHRERLAGRGALPAARASQPSSPTVSALSRGQRGRRRRDDRAQWDRARPRRRAAADSRGAQHRQDLRARRRRCEGRTSASIRARSSR